MSFILDALKKAESERSRNAGPVLMDVRIAPSRQRLPLWAWALGVVLLANLLVLGWLVLRKPAAAPPAAPVIAAALPSPAPAAATPAAVAQVSAVMPAAAPQTASQLPAEVVASATPAPMPMPAVVPAPVPSEALPTLQDVLASGLVLPPLQLVLHVYDEVPANRYVLLNSRRLREGEELSDGIRVDRITARGVVLDARGRRFLLPAGS